MGSRPDMNGREEGLGVSYAIKEEEFERLTSLKCAVR